MNQKSSLREVPQFVSGVLTANSDGWRDGKRIERNIVGPYGFLRRLRVCFRAIGSAKMCDYSLQNVKSRPAKVGDKLTTRNFGTGTLGFAASEDASVAVCVLPGTELSFAAEVKRDWRVWPWQRGAIDHRTAIFRQINKDKKSAHHDAVEFPDGQIVLLTHLRGGQRATVLQLPAEPKTATEIAARQRVAYVG